MVPERNIEKEKRKDDHACLLRVFHLKKKKCLGQCSPRNEKREMI
jgi:hypothetical protein